MLQNSITIRARKTRSNFSKDSRLEGKQINSSESSTIFNICVAELPFSRTVHMFNRCPGKRPIDRFTTRFPLFFQSVLFPPILSPRVRQNGISRVSTRRKRTESDTAFSSYFCFFPFAIPIPPPYARWKD